jgi:dipeptidyl aminopeptidase/acylaminoacyl peptidase
MLNKVLASSFIALCALLSYSQTPHLIPREVIFGDPPRAMPQISPDGRRLSYLAPVKGIMNIWTKTIGGNDEMPLTNELKLPIGEYRWAEDNVHILYVQDVDGDENFHVLSVELPTKQTRDLTPFVGAKAQNLLTSPKRPNEILVGLNLRDRRIFDMYRIDLSSGAVTLDTRNAGDVLSWATDSNFLIRAATAYDLKSGDTILRVRNTVREPWRDLMRWPFEQSMLWFGQTNGGGIVAGFSPSGNALAVISAADSDKAKLVRLDARTGKVISIIAKHANSDVASKPALNTVPLLSIDPLSQQIQAVGFEYLSPEWKFLDPNIRAIFDELQKQYSGFLEILSRDRHDSKWVLAERRSDRSPRYFLYDRQKKSTQLIFAANPALERYDLPNRQAVSIPTSDGLQLVSYITSPAMKKGEKLPLIVIPHGGPWERDHWEFDPEAAFFASRGYVVLQVNYRGSSGFGKHFLNAGNHEFGRQMLQDVIEGVRWAITRGLADSRRVVIYGASAGGYATLRALEDYPEIFVCGADAAGPTDLKLQFESMPAWWGPVKSRWVRRIGDVEHNDNLNRELSPLYHVKRIRVPLLVQQGGNDPRVSIKNSDLLVKALREKKVPVTYVVYPDEGHGFDHPANLLDFYGRLEEFFRGCAGTEYQPWTKVPGSTGELR